MRRLLLGLLLGCAGVLGCRHQVKPVAIQVPPPSPVPLDPAVVAKNPPLLASVPAQPIPLAPVVVPQQKKVKRVRRAAPAPPPAAPAPVQMANVTPATVLAAPAAGNGSLLGTLTAGGMQDPETRRAAVELIAVLDKRLAGLTPEFKEKQKEELLRVVNFQRQAQAALGSGDAEGALTLANKARLLLDDLQK